MIKKPQATTSMISAENLSKVFRDFWCRPKVHAVENLTFEIHRGEVFGLLGPNGSGKSTTIKMMLGLLYPTKGTLTVLGESPRSVKTKSKIGYLAEESYLYPYLTAEETIRFYGGLFNLRKKVLIERTDELLEMIGLQHARGRPVGEFSKGMARRIGLAQALINDPDFVLLDEPTSGLDPIGCRHMKDLILALKKRGKTILLSSHLLADVEDVCDRVAILYNGRIHAMGALQKLLEKRSQHTLTLPEMKSDQLQSVLAALRKILNEEPNIKHPRLNLEQFFLEIIARAQRETSEPSGVENAQGLAPYLSEHDHDDASTPAP